MGCSDRDMFTSHANDKALCRGFVCDVQSLICNFVNLNRVKTELLNKEGIARLSLKRLVRPFYGFLFARRCAVGLLVYFVNYGKNLVLSNINAYFPLCVY